MPINPNQEPGTTSSAARAAWIRMGVIALGIAVLVAVVGLIIRSRSAREVTRWTQEQMVPTVAVITAHLGGGRHCAHLAW